MTGSNTPWAKGPSEFDVTAKQQVNFEDQVLGLFSGTKTRRKIIARTVRAHSAGAKN